MTETFTRTRKDRIHLTQVTLSAFGIAVAYVLIIAMNNILYEDHVSWSFMLHCSLCGAPFIIVAGLFIQWLVRICNRQWWSERYWRWVFVAQMAVSIGLAIGLTILAFVVFDPIDHESFAGLSSELYFRISMIAVSLLSLLIVFLAKYAEQLDYSKVKERELEENNLRLTEMRYHQLKAQVNPHFLFNSLNVLVSLISIDQNRAVKYTTELASIYRYLLSHDDQAMSSLREELDFCTQYSNIMRMRFAEGLNVRLPKLTDPTVGNLQIIPTAIQVLIENACKHNCLSKEKPLTIEVFIDEGFVVVTNNISLRSRPSDSTGLGLSGLVSKYEMITKRRVVTEQTDERFTVKVPLLTHDECRNLFTNNEKPN